LATLTFSESTEMAVVRSGHETVGTAGSWRHFSSRFANEFARMNDLQILQKVDQQLVDLLGPLLLNPMSRVEEQILLQQIWGVGFERLISVPPHIHHHIAIAGNKYGW
jgi:hypothetical protein